MLLSPHVAAAAAAASTAASVRVAALLVSTHGVRYPGGARFVSRWHVHPWPVLDRVRRLSRVRARNVRSVLEGLDAGLEGSGKIKTTLAPSPDDGNISMYLCRQDTLKSLSVSWGSTNWGSTNQLTWLTD